MWVSVPESEGPGVMVHMVPHEGGDEEVAVVIQRLHPQLNKIATS